VNLLWERVLQPALQAKGVEYRWHEDHHIFTIGILGRLLFLSETPQVAQQDAASVFSMTGRLALEISRVSRLSMHWALAADEPSLRHRVDLTPMIRLMTAAISRGVAALDGADLEQ
jgi:hypothetical protein